MSPFLNSLQEELAAMEQELQALPGELDSILRRLDGRKLKSLLSRLNQNCDILYDKQRAAQISGLLPLPYIIQATGPLIRPVTSEDLSRWREAYKSEVRVVIGKGKVWVITRSELANEYKKPVSQISLAAQEQGYIVLSWEQYQKLFNEIGKLIGEERGRITGLPLLTQLQNRATKLLT
jgi:hypothetical protein